MSSHNDTGSVGDTSRGGSAQALSKKKARKETLLPLIPEVEG